MLTEPETDMLPDDPDVLQRQESKRQARQAEQETEESDREFHRRRREKEIDKIKAKPDGRDQMAGEVAAALAWSAAPSLPKAWFYPVEPIKCDDGGIIKRKMLLPCISAATVLLGTR